MDPRIQKLHDRMTGTRLKAPGTIASYELISRQFLLTLKGTFAPTRADVDHYIKLRRAKNVSERTLRKECFALAKLFSANGWTWPLDKDDFPLPEDETRPEFVPLADVEKLIMSQKKLSSADRFYLAVATTWCVRRTELGNIRKRDFDGESILIHTAKHGKPVKALIPDVLKPIFSAFRPKGRAVSSLSAIFNHICDKAGVKRPDGVGWHGLRYTVDSFLIDALEKKGLSLTLMKDYAGWKPRRLADEVGGAEMMHRYHHPEIVNPDPYRAFKIIYPIHPFLAIWARALGKKVVA